MALSRKIVHLALLALISVSTFFSSPGFTGLVLCLGNDGHFELESSINGKCGTSAASAHGPSLIAADEESHCGSCTDVSFLAMEEDLLRPAQEIAFSNHPVVAALLEVASPLFLDRLTLGQFPQPPPLENQVLAHIRTVRLLV
jgi:hypothetical protein